MRTDGVKLMMLSLLLCVHAVGCGKPSNESAQARTEDPVAALQALLARIEKDGTEERVADAAHTWGDFEKGWVKRKYVAHKLKYDVQKTNSLVAPIVAIVQWIPVQYSGPVCQTREQAAQTALAGKPSEVWHFAPWIARLSWRDGKWVLSELGWGEVDAMGQPRNHETVGHIPDDPINDWWRAFGGV